MERPTEPDGESWGPAGTPSERGTCSKYSTVYSGEQTGKAVHNLFPCLRLYVPFRYG